MKKQHVFLILILIINLISCSDENKSTLGSFQGIYFMGEGNFTRGNAKLDLYQYQAHYHLYFRHIMELKHFQQDTI